MTTITIVSLVIMSYTIAFLMSFFTNLPYNTVGGAIAESALEALIILGVTILVLLIGRGVFVGVAYLLYAIFL